MSEHEELKCKWCQSTKTYVINEGARYRVDVWKYHIVKVIGCLDCGKVTWMDEYQ
jgi:uncharacterized Zn finger protein